MNNYQLEIRTYTREEMAKIAGVDVKDSRHFKRNVETYLKNSGYSYDENMRKGVTIIAAPETAHQKLNEILYRYYNLDIKVNTFNFAIFFYCMFTDNEGFASMPWLSRQEFMNEKYNVNVDEKTLRNWCSKLINRGVLVKSDGEDEITYWKTEIVDRETRIRTKVEKNDAKRIEYWKRFWELKNNNIPQFMDILLDEFKACYYSCKKFVCAAWDNETEINLIEEILCLVMEIAMEKVNNPKLETVVVSSTKIEVVEKEEVIEDEEEEVNYDPLNCIDADGNFKF